eukprot:TRINITY_DN12144_c0_g1_i2.p1 TRINITY_DN12144_c0_g1~~TRINITY_DN12144_c0_g1_i2.p1  ORF type:complete len:205 (-),score=49.41 TRINITY_DN12144_c0_g1_i2:133-747(-)
MNQGIMAPSVMRLRFHILSHSNIQYFDCRNQWETVISFCQNHHLSSLPSSPPPPPSIQSLSLIPPPSPLPPPPQTSPSVTPLSLLFTPQSTLPPPSPPLSPSHEPQSLPSSPSIFSSNDMIEITHQKWEETKPMKFEFCWNLTILTDNEVKSILDAFMKIVHVKWIVDVPGEERESVIDSFSQFYDPSLDSYNTKVSHLMKKQF